MRIKPNKKSKWMPCLMCNGRVIRKDKNRFRCKDCGAVYAVKEANFLKEVKKAVSGENGK